MTFKTSPVRRLLLTAGLLAASQAQAQSAPPIELPANRPSSLGWQACQALKGDTAQLACFQQ